MRVLGVDYGRARIGLAMGDTDSGIASPLSVLEARPAGKVFEALKDLIEREQIGALVIGVPHPLADQSRDTDQTEEVRRFAEELKRFGVPVMEENETWSTALAQGQQHELGEKRKRDDLAAAVILQTYLDRLRQILPK